MKTAAARAIADIVTDDELREDYIIPSVFNRDVAPAVAAAVAEEARVSGTAEAGAEIGFAADRGLPRPAQPMRVTLTGATGLIGRRLIAALRGRGDEVTVLSRDPGKAEQTLSGVRAVAWNPLADPAPCPRSPMPMRSSTSPASPSPSAGMPTSRSGSGSAGRLARANLVAGLRAADPRPARARLDLGLGLLRRPRRRAADRVRDARHRLPGRGLQDLGGRRDRSRVARTAGDQGPHRRRPDQRRRRAQDDAAAVQGRRRWSGRGGPPVHPLDPPRRPGRDLPGRARRRRLVGGGQRLRSRARSPTRPSRRRSATRCTAPP